MTLNSPFYPGPSRFLTVRIGSEPGIVPRGDPLIAVLVATIYDSWKDTANLKIRSTIVARKPLFTNFQWTITPKLGNGAVLTPEKIGTIACWIMQFEFARKNWAGHVRAWIWDFSEQSTYALEVGSLEIEYLGSSLSHLSASNGSEAVFAFKTALPISPRTFRLGNRTSADAANGIIPSTLERPWFQCFVHLYYGILQKYFADNVGDDNLYPIPITGGPTIVKFPCPGSPADEIDSTLYPAAAPESPHRLTWDRLAKSMVDWI